MTTPKPATTEMPPMLVTAALVTFKNPDGRVEYRYRAAQVPTWCDQDEFNRYARDGLIEMVDADTYRAAADEPGEAAFQAIASRMRVDRGTR